MYRPEQDRETDLDIRDLLGAIGQSFWKLLLISFLLGCLAFIALSFVKPLYSSEAQLILKPSSVFGETKTEQQGRRGNVLLNESTIRGQIQVVRSRDLLEEVAKELSLENVLELNSAKNNTWLGDLTNILTGSQVDSRAPAIESVINEMVSRLKVYTVNKSNVLAVQFRSSDPVLSQNVANTVSKRYLERSQESSIGQRREAAKKLLAVVHDTETQLLKAERDMRTHMAKHSINQLPNRGGTLLQNQIRVLSEAISADERRATDAQAAADDLSAAIKNGGDISSTAYVVKSRAFERLTGQRDSIQQQLDVAGATLGRKHPRMQQLRSGLARLNRQLQTQLERIVERSKNEALVASNRVEQKKKQLASLISKDDETNPEQAELIQLQVKARSLRTNLASYQQKLADAQTTSGSELTPVTAAIISKAHIATTPYFPKLLPMSLLAMLACFLLGIGYVVLRALMATTTTAVDYWREASHEFEGRLLTHSEDRAPAALIKDDKKAN